MDPERARLRDAMHAARAAAAGSGVARWERELAARGVLYQAKTTRHGTIIGYRVSLPGWTDTDDQQVWLKASQVDRTLSWNRVRPELDAARPDPTRPGNLPPVPSRHDHGPRSRSTAPQLAHQAFAVPPKPPVVTRGDAEELANALLVRVRQRWWYERLHQQQRRGR